MSEIPASAQTDGDFALGCLVGTFLTFTAVAAAVAVVQVVRWLV